MKYKTLTNAIAMSVGILTAPLALADLNEGLVAYYPFNGNANDESGNGLDGIVNGATLTEDRLGNADSAYSFDGVNDLIKVPTSFNSTSITIGAWIHLNDYRCYGGIVDGYQNQWELVLDCPNGNKLEFAQWKKEGGYNDHVGSNLLPLQKWHYITVAINETSGTFYINGSKDSSFTMSALPLAEVTQFMIGVSMSGSPQYFSGIIDDVHIYNRALTESEIQALYAGVPEDGDCQHATYSLKKRTLTVPFVEMPVVDFLTGQPTGEMELWTGSLRQVLGTTNRFRLINKTVAQITDGSSSRCPATYSVDTGTLRIPYIDVPTGIAVGNQKIENGVDVFKATMTWEPMGRSFVVQEVEKLLSIPKKAKSCADLKANDGSATDGIYEIDPDGTGGNQPFEVYCDMSTDNGGFTFAVGNTVINSFDSIKEGCPNSLSPFQLISDSHGIALHNYVVNQLEENTQYWANVFAGPHKHASYPGHNDDEYGYLDNNGEWHNADVDESQSPYDDIPSNWNLNIFDPIPLVGKMGYYADGKTVLYNSTERVIEGYAICSTNDK